jgi:hypothetical protein
VGDAVYLTTGTIFDTHGYLASVELNAYEFSLDGLYPVLSQDIDEVMYYVTESGDTTIYLRPFKTRAPYLGIWKGSDSETIANLYFDIEHPDAEPIEEDGASYGYSRLPYYHYPTDGAYLLDTELSQTGIKSTLRCGDLEVYQTYEYGISGDAEGLWGTEFTQCLFKMVTSTGPTVAWAWTDNAGLIELNRNQNYKFLSEPNLDLFWKESE